MKNKITRVMHGKLPWIAALLLVIISIACYQTYAWFSHQKKIAEQRLRLIRELTRRERCSTLPGELKCKGNT
ncbi:MAG: hypothetical protein K6F31_03055 [Acetatifactor sp.]|nr:hypothetical protein [Acetatifactor sp.]